MDMYEDLRRILQFHVEAYGGKTNPKDDFSGFIYDIKKWLKHHKLESHPANIEEIEFTSADNQKAYHMGYIDGTKKALEPLISAERIKIPQIIYVPNVEKLVDALQLILPMAKGYVNTHNVGSNQEYINIAEQVLYEYVPPHP